MVQDQFGKDAFLNQFRPIFTPKTPHSQSNLDFWGAKTGQNGLNMGSPLVLAPAWSGILFEGALVVATSIYAARDVVIHMAHV